MKRLILTGSLTVLMTVFSLTASLAEAVPPETCCDLMGDANDSWSINILDVTYLIAYLYKGGYAPPCFAEGDVNCDCKIDMVDVTRYIGWVYKHWPYYQFCTCEEWEANCGEN